MRHLKEGRISQAETRELADLRNASTRQVLLIRRENQTAKRLLDSTARRLIDLAKEIRRLSERVGCYNYLWRQRYYAAKQVKIFR